MRRANSTMSKDPGIRPNASSKMKPSFGGASDGSMKFNLPTSGLDQVNFQLSGFKEMAEFKDAKILSRPPPSSMLGNYKLNTKPGRSIPKFNIKDLPQDIDFDHDLFKAESFYEKDEPSLATLRNQAIAALKKDFMKPGGGIYGVRRTSQAASKSPKQASSKPSQAARANNNRAKKEPSAGDSDDDVFGEGETFMSNTDRIRLELIKVQQGVRENVKKDIGFGFRNQKDSIKTKIEASIQQELNASKEPMKAKTDKSVRALQEKIKQQRQKMKEMREQSRSPSRSPSRTRSITRKNPVTLKTEEFVNEKLAAISQHFRESLKESTKEMMKSTGKLNKKPITSSDKVFVPALKPAGSENPRKDWKQTDAHLKDGMSTLLTRPSSKFVPAISKVLKNVEPRLKQPPTPNPIATKKKPSKTIATGFEDDPSQLDYSGIMKLRSLLETNAPELNAKPSQRTQSDTRRRNVEPQALPAETLEQIKREGQAQSGILNRNRMAQEKELQVHDPYSDDQQKPPTRRKSVAFALDVQTSPRNEGLAGRGLYKNFNYSVNQADLSERAYPQVPTNVVRQKIGESVKTLDDATRVANALGGLMTRVGVARDINKPTTGTATMTASEIGTMTEGPGFRGMYKIPDIKFTKDMSEADQLQLLELRRRSKSHNWNAVNFS